jgi:aminoglycoside phosphotransferase (APT) family kinase protein
MNPGDGVGPHGDSVAGEAMRQALLRLGLATESEDVVLVPLAGGIASDIWLADVSGRRICIKKALHQLKVDVEWRVPIERNLYEWRYCRVAEAACPGLTPRLLARDADAYLFAMEYLDPSTHPLWKEQLRDGIADASFAGAVGAALARVHSYAASHRELEPDFPSDDIFYASRMESYLEATARVHPALRERLFELIGTVMNTKHSLVHGDVSPKNILNGPRGPVFLDAECAFYGDPAFDLAFCLNHLLLKCLWTPRAKAGFVDCYGSLAHAYLSGVDWEPADDVEARTAHLLPGLFLARVDGKSKVEYISREEQKELVRDVATRFLTQPVERLAEVAGAWLETLESRGTGMDAAAA